MCHASDPAQPAAAADVDGGRVLVVRKHDGDRTDEYKRLMGEMGMPCGVAGQDFDVVDGCE